MPKLIHVDHSGRLGRQRGAATLIVVMILFFVISLAAAYASRNLIFDQRTAANQYRSTAALEAAEAGIEWAVAMLNAGRIDESCRATSDPTAADNRNFRQRYLSADTEGRIVPRPVPTAGGTTHNWSACSSDGGAWTCTCPVPGSALGTLPQGKAAFAVRFVGLPLTPDTKPGVVRIEVNGCTSNSIECLTATGLNTNNNVKCQSTNCSLLAMYPSLRQRPIAAITAGGDVTGSRLQAYNTDALDMGIAVLAGGTITNSNLITGGAPGTPVALSLRASDSAIAHLDAHADDCDRCLFSSVFGLRPKTYRDALGVAQVDCGSGGCTSVASGSPIDLALNSLRGQSSAVDGTPWGNILWLKGNGGLRLSSSDVLGSATAPVTVISEGPVSITGPARIWGLVFAPTASIDDGSSIGAIQGALITAGNVSGSGATTTNGLVNYNRDVLDRLQKFNGTFVRVPGSWRDFP